MMLYGQRWVFNIENALVKVDNGFSWSLWSQERLLVNDEPARLSGSRLRFRRKYQEPWLTRLGDEMLEIVMVSRATGFVCEATLSGEFVAPSATLEAVWRGNRFEWPEEAAWKPASRHGWIVEPLPV